MPRKPALEPRKTPGESIPPFEGSGGLWRASGLSSTFSDRPTLTSPSRRGNLARLRAMLGLAAGLMLIASSAAHSLFGWKPLRAELESASAPSELTSALELGWHFAGAAMLTMGCIVSLLFTRRLVGDVVSSAPAVFVAILYLAFGGAALYLHGMDASALVFIVPGLLLAVAAVPDRRRRARR
jgi:hypothetical protein